MREQDACRLAQQAVAKVPGRSGIGYPNGSKLQLKY